MRVVDFVKSKIYCIGRNDPKKSLNEFFQWYDSKKTFWKLESIRVKSKWFSNPINSQVHFMAGVGGSSSENSPGTRNTGWKNSSGSAGSKALIILAVLLVVIFGAGALAYVFPSASNQYYAPEQPIPYSHKLHAGDLKIPCLYCHVGADESQHAGVPPMNVCMNCHSVVAADSPHIQKLKQLYEEGKPIEWVRIHNLPDFVYFPHYRHVNKGVSCETCHGEISEMEKVYQAKPLTMGWCLDCHQGETTPKEVLKRIHPEVKDARGMPVATVTCSACHY